MILGLVVFSIYTVIALPYNEAIRLWRGDENVWYKTPKTAQPKWMNWFLKDDLPETLSFNTAEDQGTKTEEFSNGTNKMLCVAPGFCFRGWFGAPTAVDLSPRPI